MASDFLGKIKYKKERVGVVQKDGKTYLKYKKASRFRVSKNVKYALLSAFILFVLGLGISLLMSELDSGPPAEEIHEGI